MEHVHDMIGQGDSTSWSSLQIIKDVPFQFCYPGMLQPKSENVQPTIHCSVQLPFFFTVQKRSKTVPVYACMLTRSDTAVYGHVTMHGKGSTCDFVCLPTNSMTLLREEH